MDALKDNSGRIERFFAVHYTELHNMCVLLFRSKQKGEDALHDVFEKLLKSTAVFPQSDLELMKYIYLVMKNHRLDMMRRMTKSPFKLLRPEQLNVGVITLPGNAIKLEMVNDYMQEHAALFTAEEMTLWEVIYKNPSMEDKKQALRKTANAIAVMQHHLLDKIHRCMVHDRVL